MKKEKRKTKNEKVKTSILFTFSLLLFTCEAAVPLTWTVETSRAQPATFEAYQGETLTFEAALQSHGKPLEAPLNYSLFWQTNGMGNAYWEAPANVEAAPSPLEVRTNVLFATWLPDYDVGAKVYNCFIGSPSNIYHAAFQLRLRPSPGALPNALPLPTPVIDFARVRVLNPPWSGGGGGSGVDTNAVERIANKAVETNAVTVGLSSSVSGLQSSKVGRDEINVTGSSFWIGSWLDDFLVWSIESAGDFYGQHFTVGNIGAYRFGSYPIFAEFRASTSSPFGRPELHADDGTGSVVNLGPVATLNDLPVIDATDPTFSNAVATVARTVTPPPSPTLRVYDEVRQCYWLGKMVNGVIQWEVE